MDYELYEELMDLLGNSHEDDETEEAAIANAKAMLGIDPYGEDAE